MITIVKGDITTHRDVDVIVNAAKCSLLGGGGVDGAIHRAAGPQLLEACERLPLVPMLDLDYHTCRITGGDVRCTVGDARVTSGFNLSPYIIHTVGPIYEQGNLNNCHLALGAAYYHSLKLAHQIGARTIALPAISCGVYGYPINAAASIALSKAWNFRTLFEEIRFVLFEDAVFEAFKNDFQRFDGLL